MKMFQYHLARYYYLSRFRFDIARMATVESGPFIGLGLCASGSWGGHGARLAGTYEKELNEVIEGLPTLGIDHVIDVGCADGYYACGLAHRYAFVKVTAYDISRRARWCTYSAAKHNQLLDRVSVKSFFDVTKYHSQLDKRDFLLLDCEGFESEIITSETVAKFFNTAILVECHDFIIPRITESLSSILADSHNLRFIQSRERTLKDAPALLSERDSILNDIQEGRRGTMTWIWAIPKAWEIPT